MGRAGAGSWGRGPAPCIHPARRAGTGAARLVSHIVALIAIATQAGCWIPRWPVEAPISSPFGVRLVGFWPRIHYGVDLAVPEGTPVRAMGPGRVTFAGWWGGYGIAVIIDHGGGTSSLYAHLSEARVRTGDRVGGRDVIGLSGSTGETRGAHLHFEVWRRGRREDPVPLLGGEP